MIYLIVAITEKTRAIGYKNKLLYHLPKDLKYFKETTNNHTVVMGYNTYMSLPIKPLPNRKNIVISNKDIAIDGALVLTSIESLKNYANANTGETIFICGGASIYNQTIDFVDKLFITYIEEDEEVLADTFFPEININNWILESQRVENDIKKLKFTIYKRRI